ncbi:MAG: hypothetical protein KAX40_01670 [Herpetosiphon sp.]|nr:hypothetical protein [Herpetosiphon sp.]
MRFKGKIWFVPLLMYSVLAIILTYPLITVFTTHIAGSPHKDGLEDAYQNVWNLWWMKYALTHGENPLVTHFMFAPQGATLYYHTLSPLNTIMVVPITAMVGTVAAFNSIVLISLVVGAMGAWRLAVDRTGSSSTAAMLAGFVFAWSPFHVAAIAVDGQLQIFALHWIPWYIVYAMRTVEHGGRKNIMLAALFLVCNGWTDWYYTLFLLIWTAGYALWQLGKPERWIIMRRFAVVGSLFMLGIAPLLVPMLIETRRSDYMSLYTTTNPQRLAADLLAFVVPPRLHGLWGAAPWTWGISQAVNRRFYLGMIALILAIFGLRRRATWGWLVMLVSFVMLALGSTLYLNGVATNIPLPYRVIANLPIIRLSRQPDRFAVLAFLALGVLVAYGALEVRRIMGGRWVLPLLFGLLLLDYLPTPLPVYEPPQPAFFATLPKGSGGILELPFHNDVPYRDAERMLFQTLHERPISSGYHSRLYPQQQLTFPVMQALSGELTPDIIQQTGSMTDQLTTLNYEYLIAYKQLPNGAKNYSPEQIFMLQQQLASQLQIMPFYDDERLQAFMIPKGEPVPLIGLADGWGAIEQTPDQQRYRWIGQHATISLASHADQSGLVRLRLQSAAGQRTVIVTTSDGRTMLTIDETPRDYQLWLDLPHGISTISLDSPEPPTTGEQLAGNGDTRPLSMRVFALQIQQTHK